MAIVWFSLWFFGGLVLIAAGTVCSVGAILPREHVASGSAVVDATAEAAWRRIRAAGHAPAWRRGVTKVDVLEGDADAPTKWTEHSGFGPMTMMLVREEPGRLLETRIDDSGQPFGGTWTFEVAPDGAGAKVTITERGWVGPPPFRFLSKFVFGHDATLRAYLADLQAGSTGGTGDAGAPPT